MRESTFARQLYKHFLRDNISIGWTKYLSSKVNLPPFNELQSLIWVKFGHAPPPQFGGPESFVVHRVAIKLESKEEAEGFLVRIFDILFRFTLLGFQVSDFGSRFPGSVLQVSNFRVSDLRFCVPAIFELRVSVFGVRV